MPWRKSISDLDFRNHASTSGTSSPFFNKWIKIFLPKIIEQMRTTNAAGEFNEAIMELGALICKPNNPKCYMPY